MFCELLFEHGNEAVLRRKVRLEAQLLRLRKVLRHLQLLTKVVVAAVKDVHDSLPLLQQVILELGHEALMLRQGYTFARCMSRVGSATS